MFGEIEAYCRAREQVGTVRIRFVQTTFSEAGYEDDASGVLYYRKPDQLRWEYEQPDRSWTVLVGSSGCAVYPRTKQVQYFELGSERTQDLRAVLGFGACGPEFWRSFDVVASRAEDGATVLSLTPRRPQLAALFSSIKLKLDPDDHLPRVILFHEATGDDVRFEFEDVDPDAEVSGSLFELAVPEDYRHRL